MTTLDRDRNEVLHLHPQYLYRRDAQAHDDRALRDEYQDEVYRSAYEYLHNCKSGRVLDFGCGSGYKLMKYFGTPFDQTLGYELEPTLSFLRAKYPQRRWLDGNALLEGPCDVLICADVIEHLDEPRALLARFARFRPDRIYLSTPALEVLAERGHSTRLGPPANPCHAQEWTTAEFAALVAEYLHILGHTVFCGQGTQLIVARPRYFGE